MSDAAPVYRPTYLALPLDEGPASANLLMDLRDPSDLLELPALSDLSELPASAVVVTALDDGYSLLAGEGRCLVSRCVCWSLLDPLDAGRGIAPVVTDRFAAEQWLRDEGHRFWRGLERWRALDPDLRERITRDLKAHSDCIGAFLDQLNLAAESGAADPFREMEGISAPGEAVPPPEPPTPLPEDPFDLEDWFGDPAGLGALMGADYQPRNEQGQMARDVLGALQSGSPLLMEAGTGVGKTLAYLIPLLATCAAGGCRGVVSTHTLALQAQILGADLPRLRRLFPKLVFRRLMGRRNYICRSKIELFLGLEITNLEEALVSAAFRVWLDETTDGMREEVADHPLLKTHLRALFESMEPCSPSICYGRNECFVQKARRRAREADVVLVNHSLLMNDFAAGHTLIGEYDRLVVDEAHRLSQVALDTFTISCDRSRHAVITEMLDPFPGRRTESRLLKALAAGLRGRDEAGDRAADAVETLSDRLRNAMAAYLTWIKALEASLHDALRETGRSQGRIRIHEPDEVFTPIREETETLLDACAAAAEANVKLAAATEPLPDLKSGQEDSLATATRACELLSELQQDLMFMIGGGDEDWVKWIQPGSEGGLRAVGATRLESGRLLGDLWRGSQLAPVMTSATLSVDGDFGLSRQELGAARVQASLIEVCVASPFVYEEQALFLSVPTFPAPDRPAFLPAVADLLGRLTSEVPRKTMALFTAYNALRTVASRLRGDGEAEVSAAAGRGDAQSRRWRGEDVAILSQGSGLPPAEMVARFRSERRALLLGTNTFWEGMDFPGEDLEILVVTKLPFLVPSDPWVEARCERIQKMGANPFTSFMVADAVLRLRQGVGRLIRSRADRGVVILLDSRLHAKPYGMTFLKAMPSPVQFCSGSDEVLERTGAFFS